jgi:predicted dienelactone hydrolase
VEVTVRRFIPWLLLATAACGPEEELKEVVDKSVDFAVAGPYTPGTFSDSLEGSTGVPITFQVWYPSQDEGSKTVSYDSLYAGDAYTDVSADCSDSRPVLLFSHGFMGVRWQSPFLVEHLASHGYIVAAPDHTANTFLDNDETRFLEVVERRPQDLADVFNWLVAESGDTGSDLAGCVTDADGYAVSGHSFGGYTAFAAAGAIVDDYFTSEQHDYSDDRVWAAVPLAPWDADGAIIEGSSAIEVPVMVLTGDRDTTTDLEMVQGMYDPLTVAPRYLGRFLRAGHFSFSPMACDFGLEIDNGCGEDDLDLDELATLTNVSTLAFLESVRGQPEALEQLPSTEEMVWASSEGSL